VRFLREERFRGGHGGTKASLRGEWYVVASGSIGPG
jgi:hypothetical protein